MLEACHLPTDTSSLARVLSLRICELLIWPPSPAQVHAFRRVRGGSIGTYFVSKAGGTGVPPRTAFKFRRNPAFAVGPRASICPVSRYRERFAEAV